MLDTVNSITGDATNGLRTTVSSLTLGGLTGSNSLTSLFTSTSGGFSGVSALTLKPETGDTFTYSGGIADGAAGMTLTKTGLGTDGKIAFATSSAIDWSDGSVPSGTLAITGTFVSGSSLRFGTTNTDLSATQLARITATGFGAFALDADGYLTANPTVSFSLWITSLFAGGATVPADQQGPNDDPDHDGTSNLIEYAVASHDPTSPNSSVGTLISNVLSFTKRPGTVGLTYAIQDSTDLGAADLWTELPPSPSYINDATTISHTLVPGTLPKLFLRLKVTAD